MILLTRQPKIAWHRVQVWGETAKIVSTQLPEGSQLYVEGRLVVRRWIDKRNKRQTCTEILASDVRFLGEELRTVTQKPLASGE
jgi:single stranded DNA-binding protein